MSNTSCAFDIRGGYTRSSSTIRGGTARPNFIFRRTRAESSRDSHSLHDSTDHDSITDDSSDHDSTTDDGTVSTVDSDSDASSMHRLLMEDPEFDSLKIYDNYIEGLKNSKVGRFDVNGKILLDCIYENIKNFENTEYLELVKGGKSGLSDSFGNIKIPVQFDLLTSLRENIIKINLGLKIGF